MRRTFFILICSIGTLSSCGSTKTAAEEISVIQESIDDGLLTFEGFISTKYKDQGCSYLFVYRDSSGNQAMVRPLELEERFKKEGIKVKVEFRLSRASNAGCDLANPVIIESIKEI